MTYKRTLLSILICSLLLIQPVQPSESPKTSAKPTQTTSSWFTWKNLAIAAAALGSWIYYITQSEGFKEHRKEMKNKRKKEKRTKLNSEDNEVVFESPSPLRQTSQFKRKSIQDFVENDLNDAEKVLYYQYNTNFIEYLRRKNDDGSNFFEAFNNKPLKPEWKALETTDYKNNDVLILHNQILFRQFLSILLHNDLIKKTDTFNRNFNFIKSAHDKIEQMIDKENQEKVVSTPSWLASSPEKLSDLREKYFTKVLPTYANAFNQYNSDVNEAFAESYTSVPLSTQSFIATYLKYYEPTKTLKSIEENIDILNTAAKKYANVTKKQDPGIIEAPTNTPSSEETNDVNFPTLKFLHQEENIPKSLKVGLQEPYERPKQQSDHSSFKTFSVTSPKGTFNVKIKED